SVDENGTIIAKAVGSTNIQVKSNNKTAICTVNVLDYIEFSGSAEELKYYFEETGTSAIFLKLILVYSSSDPSLFPLTVPENKYVRIDFNGERIDYSPYSGSNPTSIIKNNGGVLVLEDNYPEPSMGGIYGSYYEESIVLDDGYISAVKNEKGTLIIKNTIYSLNYYVENNKICCSIDNHDKLIILGQSYQPNYQPGVSRTFMRNASGASASLNNVDTFGTIINEGKLEMRDCKFFFNGEFIVNTGALQRMENCLITTGGNASYNAVGIESTCTIGDIINCEFVVHDGISLNLISGEANSIVNCKLFGSIEVSDDFVLSTKLTDGRYSQLVPQSLIASGYSCKASGDYFVISKD
ncbi:MAG: hypothetical protein GX802_04505, partial [Clostridiales bacterium]|nr:hypothetical protein [Clostridiales bacterium]